jgi:hypothetical protein
MPPVAKREEKARTPKDSHQASGNWFREMEKFSASRGFGERFMAKTEIAGAIAAINLAKQARADFEAKKGRLKEGEVIALENAGTQALHDLVANSWAIAVSGAKAATRKHGINGKELAERDLSIDVTHDGILQIMEVLTNPKLSAKIDPEYFAGYLKAVAENWVDRGSTIELISSQPKPARRQSKRLRVLRAAVEILELERFAGEDEIGAVAKKHHVNEKEVKRNLRGGRLAAYKGLLAKEEAYQLDNGASWAKFSPTKQEKRRLSSLRALVELISLSEVPNDEDIRAMAKKHNLGARGLGRMLTWGRLEKFREMLKIEEKHAQAAELAPQFLDEDVDRMDGPKKELRDENKLDPAENLLNIQMRRAIERALQGLKPREKAYVELQLQAYREAGTGLNFKAAAPHLGISSEGAKQIEARVRSKLFNDPELRAFAKQAGIKIGRYGGTLARHNGGYEERAREKMYTLRVYGVRGQRATHVLNHFVSPDMLRNNLREYAELGILEDIPVSALCANSRGERMKMISEYFKAKQAIA